MMNVSLKSRIARSFLSLLPKAGLVPKPGRPAGISAIIRVWNDRTWLEASVKDLKDHVDEIVAVDTGSSDGSLEILRSLAAEIPKLKVFSFPSNALWDLSNFAIEKTSFRWVMKWDADFVGFPGQESRLPGLRKFLDDLDQDVYYHLSLPIVEVTGDFAHQLPGFKIRRDMEFFTYSEAARYVPVSAEYATSPYPVKLPARCDPPRFSLRFEGVKIPLYYRLIKYEPVVAVHVNIKPAYRHLLGYFHLQWQASENFRRGQSLAAYALEQVRSRWGVADLEAAAELYMRAYAGHLLPYDSSLMALPPNVAALAEKSRFRVIYKDGKPAGRVE